MEFKTKNNEPLTAPKKMAGAVVNSTFEHLINFSAWGQVSASKPPLLLAAKR